MPRIFDGHFYVHYGLGYVESEGEVFEYIGDAFQGQSNGICGAACPGNLVLITGLHTGEVNLMIDVLDTPPSFDDTWEEIVDVSFTPTSEKVILRDWNGDTVCNIPLSLTTYRVRYCAQNMDLGHEIDTLVEDKPVDSYTLIFWAAASASDVVLKQTSATAAYWHKERGAVLQP